MSLYCCTRGATQLDREGCIEAFRKNFHQANDISFIYDSKGLICYANVAAQKILNSSEEELLNLHVNDLFPTQRKGVTFDQRRVVVLTGPDYADTYWELNPVLKKINEGCALFSATLSQNKVNAPSTPAIQNNGANPLSLNHQIAQRLRCLKQEEQYPKFDSVVPEIEPQTKEVSFCPSSEFKELMNQHEKEFKNKSIAISSLFQMSANDTLFGDAMQIKIIFNILLSAAIKYTGKTIKLEVSTKETHLVNQNQKNQKILIFSLTTNNTTFGSRVQFPSYAEGNNPIIVARTTINGLDGMVVVSTTNDSGKPGSKVAVMIPVRTFPKPPLRRNLSKEDYHERKSSVEIPGPINE